MKLKVHSIRLRAFSHKNEVNHVKQAIYNILPDEFKEKQIKESEVEPESDAGIFIESLKVLEISLNKQADIKTFISNLLEKLKKSDKEKLFNEISNRIDEECNFYIRLSKKDAMNKKFIMESNDSIQIKIKIAAFPKNKNTAIEILKGLLK